jgi:spore coat protein U-like protein
MRWAFCLGVVLAGFAAGAHAQTCTVTATADAFGTYDPFAKNDNKSNASVKIKCKSYTGTYVMALDAGLYSTGSFARQVSQGSGLYLSYQLYTDTTRSTVWGDGSSGTATISYSCSGGTCNNTQKAYGVMTAKQLVTPGSYSDTITVTVSY